MDRELKTVSLPSGKQAKIVTYFTRGEIKFINEKKWAGAEVSQNEAGSVIIKNIPVNQKLVQDDAVVVAGLKQIVDGEKSIPVNQDIVDKMESEDFDKVLVELTKVLEGKKK